LEVAIADDDVLFAAELGDVGWVAQLLRAHRRERIKVLAVDDHVWLVHGAASSITRPKTNWASRDARSSAGRELAQPEGRA
jgi:hypothetical protein